MDTQPVPAATPSSARPSFLPRTRERRLDDAMAVSREAGLLPVDGDADAMRVLVGMLSNPPGLRFATSGRHALRLARAATHRPGATAPRDASGGTAPQRR